jgi:UDP-glucose:(heptosyl)LPS alpha-1,3-glucosyltransferase
MRIAFVLHDYNRSGGHSRYVAELCVRFSRDHEVHVFANHLSKDKRDARIHFHLVPAWRLNSLTTIVSFIPFASWKLREGFDVIHCQGVCCLRNDVVTAHICNRAAYLARKSTDGRPSLRERIFHTIVSRLELWQYRLAPRRPVIAVSGRVASDVMRHYGCTTDAVHVIHHGVDADLFSPENRTRYRAQVRSALRIGEHETVFFYAGDLQKGAARCIRALARLTNGVLVCVSARAPAHYQGLAEGLGIADRVRFPGGTNQIEQFYSAADVFLMPTSYDAFGMVAFEAMASGLPVIVGRNAGVAELIEDGVNGLLLHDAACDEELARHMERLQQDRGLRTRLGCAARKTAERQSWDYVAEQTLKVYE